MFVNCFRVIMRTTYTELWAMFPKWERNTTLIEKSINFPVVIRVYFSLAEFINVKWEGGTCFTFNKENNRMLRMLYSAVPFPSCFSLSKDSYCFSMLLFFQCCQIAFFQIYISCNNAGVIWITVYRGFHHFSGERKMSLLKTFIFL